MFQSHTADRLVPPPLCLRPPSPIQALTGILALQAALLPRCPRLTSPVSLIVKVPVGLMLKPAFFIFLLQSTLGADYAAAAAASECVEEERCVDLFSAG